MNKQSWPSRSLRSKLGLLTPAYSNALCNRALMSFFGQVPLTVWVSFFFFSDIFQDFPSFFSVSRVHHFLCLSAADIAILQVQCKFENLTASFRHAPILIYDSCSLMSIFWRIYLQIISIGWIISTSRMAWTSNLHSTKLKL